MTEPADRAPRTLRVPRAFAAAVVALAGCFASGRTLHGFPELEGRDPREEADRMELAVRNTEAALEKAASAREEGATHGCETISELRLVDAYVALGADAIAPATGLEPQGTATRRVPLFLYPRATCPIVAEASRLGGGPQEAWVLPVLLNREAFGQPRSLSTILGAGLSSVLLPAPACVLPESGPDLLEALRAELHFTLVPRDRDHRDEVPLDDRDDAYVVLPDLDLRDGGRFGDDAPETLQLHPREDALEVILRLPTEVIEKRWAAIGATPLHGAKPNEELFDLRVFPRIHCAPASGGGPWGAAIEALRAGRWPEAHRRMRQVVHALTETGRTLQDVGVDAASAAALADAFDLAAGTLLYFRNDLAPLAKDARRLARALESGRLPAIQAAAHARDLERAFGTFVEDDPCPAPVLLDEPEPKQRSFSFIVGADLQYDSDGSNLAGFLSMIDPASAAESTMEMRSLPSIPKELEEEIRRVKFVLIVGDFGDGKGLSSSGLAPVADAFGLSAPRSPYAHRADPKQGEFPELREQIRRSSKAIFAVPGNHDGFAAYGGILNQLTAGLGYGLRALPLTGAIGDWLVDDFSGGLPTIARLLRLTPPFYDGLVDWVY
ncbi:MAG TPA: hypothetical protein VKE69_09285, partial [Planctomycetota bacterium]|nr:hypothetical protein [Planctomycetota bacterium]